MSNKDTKKAYEKITKEQVFDVMVGITLDFIAPDHVINLVNIADLLKTSRYQVKKYMDELREEGLVELKTTMAYNVDEEPSRPYTGYRLTAKGMETEEFKQLQSEHLALIESCFGGGSIDI